MNWMNIISSLIAAGIGGSIVAVINQDWDRKKFLYKEKLEAFTELIEEIASFSEGRGKSKNLFDNLAIMSRTRLLLRDNELGMKIKKYFLRFDRFNSEIKKEILKGVEADKEFSNIQKEGEEIIELLRVDLEKTIKGLDE